LRPLLIISVTVFFLVVKPVNLMIGRFHLSPGLAFRGDADMPGMLHRHPAEGTPVPELHERAAPPARPRTGNGIGVRTSCRASENESAGAR